MNSGYTRLTPPATRRRAARRDVGHDRNIALGETIDGERVRDLVRLILDRDSPRPRWSPLPVRDWEPPPRLSARTHIVKTAARATAVTSMAVARARPVTATVTSARGREMGMTFPVPMG